MTNLVQKTKSQRKTFTIPNYIVKELEDYARNYQKKQSQVIALALEEFLHKKNSDKVAKRLEALKNITNLTPKDTLKNLRMKDILKEKALYDA
jgi:rRNA-processing protein FCF1